MSSSTPASRSSMPFIVGVAGCSGSGKSSTAKEIEIALNMPSTAVLDMVCICAFPLVVCIAGVGTRAAASCIALYSFHSTLRFLAKTPLFPHAVCVNALVAVVADALVTSDLWFPCVHSTCYHETGANLSFLMQRMCSTDH